MKAVQIKDYGGINVLEINTNVSKPTLKKDQVLVEVHVASINPFDWKIRSGFFKENIPLAFPVVLGGDFSGIVIEVGEGITEYKLGDEIYGSANILNGGSGSFAEIAAVNIANSAHKPNNLRFEETA